MKNIIMGFLMLGLVFGIMSCDIGGSEDNSESETVNNPLSGTVWEFALGGTFTFTDDEVTIDNTYDGADEPGVDSITTDNGFMVYTLQ